MGTMTKWPVQNPLLLRLLFVSLIPVAFCTYSKTFIYHMRMNFMGVQLNTCVYYGYTVKIYTKITRVIANVYFFDKLQSIEEQNFGECYGDFHTLATSCPFCHTQFYLKVWWRNITKWQSYSICEIVVKNMQVQKGAKLHQMWY